MNKQNTNQTKSEDLLDMAIDFLKKNHLDIYDVLLIGTALSQAAAEKLIEAIERKIEILDNSGMNLNLMPALYQYRNLANKIGQATSMTINAHPSEEQEKSNEHTAKD